MATDVASMTNDFASMTTGVSLSNYLPDEVLARILAPVDLKSLVQARGVCKSWRASVESKQVSDLRATATERWPSLAEPLIALIGGSDYFPGTSGNISTKISFRIGIDGPWFDGPPMPEPRYLHGAAAVGRKICVVGGSHKFGEAPERTLVYDIWTAKWTDAPGVPCPRHAPIVAALPDGRIMCAGGIGQTGPELRSCEIFDPKTGLWSAGARLGHPRWRAVGALLEGQLVVAGGQAFGDESNTVERYDAAADRWEFLPPVKGKVFGGCAAAVGSHLMIFHGRHCYLYAPRLLAVRKGRTYEEPTVLRRVEKSDVTPDHVRGWNTDGGLGICRPVAVRGTKGRIIGDYGAFEQCGAGRTGPFDILVTDDEQHLEKWLGKWWTEIREFPSQFSHARPSQKKEKRYVVEVDRAPTTDALRALQEGVTTPLSGVNHELST